eukprot:13460270-Alexandrium_andersonii.AAC.1
MELGLVGRPSGGSSLGSILPGSFRTIPSGQLQLPAKSMPLDARKSNLGPETMENGPGVLIQRLGPSLLRWRRPVWCGV